MGQTKTDLTAYIEVVGQTGQQHTLDEYTNYRLHQPTSGARTWVPGSRYYRLDGEHCNELPNGDFEMVLTGEILRRV